MTRPPTWTDATPEEHAAFMAQFPELRERPQAGIEAEARLLALGFAKLSALDPILGRVLPSHFADDLHRQVWAELVKARQQGEREIDIVTVHHRLEGPPDLLPALAAIEQQSPGVQVTADRVQSLAGTVLALARRREQEAALNAAAALAFDRERPAAQRLEEARKLLENVTAALGRADGSNHPLAQFVTLRKKPQAVKWVVPGVIEEGVVTIAGARGVGKTTSLLPLALSAAGLHEPGYPLAPHPDRWRHVVYAVEQVEQAERILAGIVECSGIGVTWEQVEERLHLVEAKRLNVDTVVQVAGTYREQFTRVVDGVEVLPLVVFDTQAASFEMDNENDNAEASRIMAALKQRFERLPVWIVGHVAKASIGRNEVKTLTARGAGAFEADSIANLYLTTDEKTDQRFLSIGKRRAEPRFGDDLLIESGDRIVTGFNEWGEPEDVHLRWASVRPMEQTRQEARQEAQEAAERERRGDLREAIFDAVQVAWQAGHPLSKTGVKTTVRDFKKSDIWTEVEALLAEGWLYEVEVPRKERIGSKASFLVKLDTPEHDVFMRSGIVPDAKQVIPQSWKKPAKAPVPEVEAENVENGVQADPLTD